MSKEEENKAVVARWFTEFWGKDVNLAVVDEIAGPDMLLKHSLHEPSPRQVRAYCAGPCDQSPSHLVGEVGHGRADPPRSPGRLSLGRTAGVFHLL